MSRPLHLAAYPASPRHMGPWHTACGCVVEDERIAVGVEDVTCKRCLRTMACRDSAEVERLRADIRSESVRADACLLRAEQAEVARLRAKARPTARARDALAHGEEPPPRVEVDEDEPFVVEERPYRCNNNSVGYRCSPHGHATLEEAERHCERLNQGGHALEYGEWRVLRTGDEP